MNNKKPELKNCRTCPLVIEIAQWVRDAEDFGLNPDEIIKAIKNGFIVE
jgi:hypothetical protein